MIELIESWTRAILPGIVVAVVASYVTVRLSMRRFHEEKWWEKKEMAYARLLESIHHFKEYVSRQIEEVEGERTFTDEERKEWQGEWKTFGREYAKQRDLASLHLAPAAVIVLDQYDKKKREAAKKGRDNNWYDWMCADLGAASECLEKLKVVAKKDLRVR